MGNKPLIIIGASARAAAFSAYRAGYAPYWMDQFGDEDLRQRFPGVIISAYPGQAVELIGNAPPAPFIYTGALENHARVLEELCRRRTLLGNPVPVCSGVRDPSGLYKALRRNRVACPEIRMVKRGQISNLSPCPDDWLLKPLRSAGGIGIRRYQGETIGPGYFLQQYLPGESYSAVFVAGPGCCRLLGVTRQLVGLPEFHAGEFSYCGSIGPLRLDGAEDRQWRRIGEVISAECKLKGLFGVDAIKYQGSIYPVEVNPRYTASVEVLELALGYRAIELHCDACNNQLPDCEKEGSGELIGKAILFAPADLVFREFPQEGFAIADVPAPGTEIKQHHPVLTVMVGGTGIDSVSAELKKAARQVFKNLGFMGSE